MAGVVTTVFGGMQPRTSNDLLPDNGAVRSENVKLSSGKLVPLNAPRIVYTPNKALPAQTIYRARSENSAGWMTWPFDVDVVRVPFSSEVESRYCWTGDGEPKVADHSEAISGGDDDYPHVYYALGIPNPQAKPTVTPSGGTGSTVDRFYCCTFISSKNEESGPSPISGLVSGKTDGSWAIANLDAFPTNSGTGSATYAAGVTTFTMDSSAAHWLRKADPIVIGGQEVKVHAVVLPSVFKVLGDFSTETTWARKTPWRTTGLKRRLYRTTGSSGSWQLVSDDVGTTYTDTLSDSAILGDELISDGWQPPPADLRGLCVHSSGSVVGFSGNRLWFSEPLQPHAYIEANCVSTDYPVVGIAAFGSSIGVGTTGRPYVATGTEPGSISCEPAGTHPCLSKRSVIGVGDGILYSAIDGLIYIGQSGEQIFTANFYTREEWKPLNPSSMVCEFAGGTVYCRYETALGESEILLFSGAIHIVVGIVSSDLYSDQGTNELYIGMSDGIYLFDPSEESFPMTSSWRSKDFTFTAPLNFGAAKIDFRVAIDPSALSQLIAERAAAISLNESMISAGGFFGSYGFFGYADIPVGGSRAYYVPPIPPNNEIQFTLRSGEKIVFQKVIKDTKAFKLPSGIKYDRVSFEISGQGEITAVRVAETMKGLATL